MSQILTCHCWSSVTGMRLFYTSSAVQRLMQSRSLRRQILLQGEKACQLMSSWLFFLDFSLPHLPHFPCHTKHISVRHRFAHSVSLQIGPAIKWPYLAAQCSSFALAADWRNFAFPACLWYSVPTVSSIKGERQQQRIQLPREVKRSQATHRR